MLKRFFIAFTGSLAAIWLSGLLFLILIVMAVIVAGVGSNESVKLKDHSILRIDLAGVITERPEGNSYLNSIYDTGSAPQSQALNEIVGSILKAATDKSIDGIFIDCQGSSAGIATRCDIIGAIETFKKSGKWVIAYGDSYDQGDYLIATTADTVFVNPQGVVNVAGLSSTTMFFKDLLDKVGVEAQVIKVGTYKSAVEPYLLNEMSEANREQVTSYVDGIWKTLTPIIAKNRKVTEADVNMWADSLCLTWPASRLVDSRIVDRTAYRHEVEELLADMTGRDSADDLRFITPSQMASATDLLNHGGGDYIAVLYASGDIVDTGSEGISAEVFVPEILDLAADDDVKGLVLRVNSGGGSAFASEQIWEALERFKDTGKPFYVSMGDVAASGGYYISCGADKIYADRQTLTGSIGIFGIIPCAKTLLNDRLGVHTSTVGTNANPTFGDLSSPLTAFEREALQRHINDGYETFTGRCAEGRGLPIDSIKAIAEGRVWDGNQARRIGLIDDFSDLNGVVTAMAQELKLKKYKVKECPNADQSLWKLLTSLKSSYHEKMLRRELGDSYDIYRQVDALTHMERVQCRMEKVVLK